MKKIKSPWMKYQGEKKNEVKVPQLSIYEVFKEAVQANGNAPAYNYFGTIVSYKKFLVQVDKTAEAFKRYGVNFGDTVTICLPNFPEGVICFYALNKLGAIANMVHPLSGEGEIRDYVNQTDSKIMITLDLNKKKVKAIINETKLKYVVLVDADDSFNVFLKLGYQIITKKLFKGEKLKKPYIKIKHFLTRDPGEKLLEKSKKRIMLLPVMLSFFIVGGQPGFQRVFV